MEFPSFYWLEKACYVLQPRPLQLARCPTAPPPTTRKMSYSPAPYNSQDVLQPRPLQLARCPTAPPLQLARCPTAPPPTTRKMSYSPAPYNSQAVTQNSRGPADTSTPVNPAEVLHGAISYVNEQILFG